MAFKKFDSWEEAIKAGYPNRMGNGEYGQGGETVSRERYAKLFEAVCGATKDTGPDGHGFGHTLDGHGF